MMNTSCIFIGDQRRAAQRRLSFLVAMAATLLLFACLAVASRADLEEATRQEQSTADLACRAAGAAFAVRVSDAGTSVFICNAPARGVRRAA